jgi:hypothetical protein
MNPIYSAAKAKEAKSEKRLIQSLSKLEMGMKQVEENIIIELFQKDVSSETIIYIMDAIRHHHALVELDNKDIPF